MKELINKLVAAAATAGALDETSSVPDVGKRAWAAVRVAIENLEQAHGLLQSQAVGQVRRQKFTGSTDAEMDRTAAEISRLSREDTQPVQRCRACGFPTEGVVG